MCFSATASFTTAALLTGIGIATLKSVRHRTQYPTAVIPLLFALQQTTEGGLWLSLTGRLPHTLSPLFAAVFLFFAYLVWPVWIPWATRSLELNYQRKKVLTLFLAIGATTSLFLAFVLYKQGIAAEILQNHIYYKTYDTPLLFRLIGVGYALATVGSLLSASTYGLPLFGIATGISLLISYYYYYACFTSVWCFFAAVLSIGIYFTIKKINKRRKISL